MKIKKAATILAFAVTAICVLASCGDEPPARSDVLADLADEIIVPSYQQFEVDAKTLSETADRLCTAPSDDGLVDTRSALATASRSWSYLESMWVGPVMDRRSWSVISWPISADEIEELITDSSIELDRDRLANRIGADQRGLDAVEYVLYPGENRSSGENRPSDIDAVLRSLADPRRCEYLEGITEVIADEAKTLVDGWTENWDDTNPYRQQFDTVGDDDRCQGNTDECWPAYRQQFDTVGDDGLDSIVNDVLFLLERITDLELGSALGIMGSETNSETRLEAIDEGPAMDGVENLISRLEGARAVLIGDEANTSGLSPLLDDELVERLSSQFLAAHAAVEGLGHSLSHAITTSPESVSAARDAIKTLQITVKTEVTGWLGVAIGFSDADGDSSG